VTGGGIEDNFEVVEVSRKQLDETAAQVVQQDVDESGQVLETEPRHGHVVSQQNAEHVEHPRALREQPGLEGHHQPPRINRALNTQT